MRILITSLNESTVTLGQGALPGNSATYTNEFGTIFSTNNDNGSGEVSLEVNGSSVSGTFNFVAFTENETDTVTFSRGFIFGVPIFGELDEDDGPLPEPDSFTARVNTVPFVPSEINTSVSSGVLAIAGTNDDDRTMSLTMPSDIAPGTYDITAGGMFTALFLTPDGVANATTGTLTIVSNNTTEQRVVGDFLFDTPNGFLITDGEFDVSY